MSHVRWRDRARAKLRALSPRTVLALGYAAFLVYAYPGYMSNDPVMQLVEARTREYTDAHPPIMAAIWTVLDAIVSGPLLMLVLQSALFLGGLFVLLRRTLSSRTAAWSAIAILLFPPVLTPMAVVWKDSQMAGWLVAGLAALTSARSRTRWIGLAMITLGCAYRHNAFAAAVPIVGLLFTWRPGVRWWKRYPVAGAIAIAVVVAAFSITRLLAVHHQRITPAFGDIVGVLTFTHERTDDDLRHVLRGTPLHVTTNIQAHARSIYSPRNYYQVSRGPNRLFDDPVTEEHWQNLDRAWKEIVLSDLGAYFAFRWNAYRELIGLTDQDPFAPVWNFFIEMPHQMAALRHHAAWSRSQERLGPALYFLASDTPLFRPYLYAALALLLLIWLCRDRVTFALISSGLLYELSFFPAAGAPDFRYSHWMIVTTLLAAVLLIGPRIRARLRSVAVPAEPGLAVPAATVARSRLTPPRILLAGWLVFLLYAYPGYMSTVAIEHLADAYRDQINGWHTSMLVEVWRTVDLVVSGPAGMLFLQSGLLLAGSYHLLARVTTARRAAIAAACILLFPPILATSAVIWPETQLAAFLVAAYVCLTSERRSIRLVGLALCMIAGGLRHGAPAATLPLVVLAFRWSGDRLQRGWRRYAIALGAWVAITLVAIGVAKLAVYQEWRRTEVALSAVDVVGVLAKADDLDDASARALLDDAPILGNDLHRRARARYGDPPRFAEGDDRVLEYPGPLDVRETEAVIEARWRLVQARPGAYLAHRADVFARTLGLAPADAWDPVYTDFVDYWGNAEIISHAARHSLLQKLLVAPMQALGKLPLLFAPYVYLVLALAGLVLAIRLRDRAALVLLASGLTFELSLFVTTAIPQFQHSYWMIVTVALACVQLGFVARQRRASRQPDHDR